MPPATKAPPAAAPLGLPGTPGRDGLNLRGGLPVAAQPQPQRAWELPTRPVPTRQAGGATGSGVGTKPSAPAKGDAGLGAEVAKSWEKANAATEKDIAKSVDAWRQAEANIGKEGAMLRSGWYQEAKADADEAVRKAIEASAQLGVVMSPYMLAAVNTRARAVAMAGYRMKSAELAVAENAQRLQVAGGISNVYQNIQRQGLDPALAANMTQQIGAGRAARDANGRLLNDTKTENDKFLAELNKIINPPKAVTKPAAAAGAPQTPVTGPAPTGTFGPSPLTRPTLLPPESDGQPMAAFEPPPSDASGVIAGVEAGAVPPKPVRMPENEDLMDGESVMSMFPPGGPASRNLRLPGNFFGSKQYQAQAVDLVNDAWRRTYESDRGTPLGRKFMEMAQLLQETPLGTKENLYLIGELRRLKAEFDALYKKQWGGR